MKYKRPHTIEVTRRDAAERQRVRAVRAEITMLEIYIDRYPEQASRFIDKGKCAEPDVVQDLVLTNGF